MSFMTDSGRYVPSRNITIPITTASGSYEIEVGDDPIMRASLVVPTFEGLTGVELTLTDYERRDATGSYRELGTLSLNSEGRSRGIYVCDRFASVHWDVSGDTDPSVSVEPVREGQTSHDPVATDTEGAEIGRKGVLRVVRTGQLYDEHSGMAFGGIRGFSSGGEDNQGTCHFAVPAGTIFPYHTGDVLHDAFTADIACIESDAVSSLYRFHIDIHHVQDTSEGRADHSASFDTDQTDGIIDVDTGLPEECGVSELVFEGAPEVGDTFRIEIHPAAVYELDGVRVAYNPGNGRITAYGAAVKLANVATSLTPGSLVREGDAWNVSVGPAEGLVGARVELELL